MTDSSSSFIAIIFGLAVFVVIVAVGWRSVQNRRIVRLQGSNGQETIIVAREDDEVSSIVSSTDTPCESHTSTGSGAAFNIEADVAGRERLIRAISSTKDPA